MTLGSGTSPTPSKPCTQSRFMHGRSCYASRVLLSLTGARGVGNKAGAGMPLGKAYLACLSSPSASDAILVGRFRVERIGRVSVTCGRENRSSPHSWGRQLVSVQFFMGPSRKRKGHALLSRLEPAAAIQFCISQFAFVSCQLSVAGFSGPERNLRVFLAAPLRAFQEYQGRVPPLAMDLHPVGVNPMAAR